VQRWNEFAFVCLCSLQASLLCCVAVVCLIGTAGALEQLADGSTVVHVRVYAPPGFLRDKPEVFVRSGSSVLVTSNMHLNGLQVDRFGNFRRSNEILLRHSQMQEIKQLQN